MTTSRKIALVAAVIVLTLIGASVWFWFGYLPSHAGTTEVLADIDAHWKQLEARPADLPAEALPNDEPRGKRATSPPLSSPRRAAKATPSPTTATGQDILNVDDTSFLIPKALFDAAAEAPKTAFAGVTAQRTAVADGSTRFTLQGIGPGSLPHAAGLRSGDTLLRVNGYELTSPDSALMAYAALRATTAYRLDILRSGRPVSLYYKVK